MERDDPKQQAQDDRERAPGVPPSPRGNPETDHDAVKKGEEQLEKVSGH